MYCKKSQCEVQVYIWSSTQLMNGMVYIPGWVNHCGLIKCIVAYDVLANEACYHATINVGTRWKGDGGW